MSSTEVIVKPVMDVTINKPAQEPPGGGGMVSESPAHSMASLASVQIGKPFEQVVKEPVPQGRVLTTPDIWEAMSCCDDDDDEDMQDVESRATAADAGLVSWERMDVLMQSYEYGARKG